MTKPNIRLGATLYSFTNAFHSRRFGLADLVHEMAARGLGPGLEVVGFQSFRSFPDVSDAEAAAFAETVAEAGLELTCLGIGADRYLRPGQPVSDEELVGFHERQMRSAAKLGFPIVRFQHVATPEVVRRLVPLADELDIRLGLEIHAPLSAGHPTVMAYREMFDATGSDRLGFIPDFAATAREVPPAMVARFRAVGVPETVIQKALDLWHDDEIEPFRRGGQFMDWCRAGGVDERLASEVMIIFGIINRADPSGWADLMPRVIHVHGKFYGIDPETGEDPAIDLEKNVEVFIRGNFRGVISSEWEGHVSGDGDGFDQVADQQALLREILSRQLSAEVAANSRVGDWKSH